jgi:hypothetical protein
MEASKKGAHRCECPSQLRRMFITSRNAQSMQTSIRLIEQIIRAKTALHLKLVAHRKDGMVEIGGGRIDDLIAEVDAGLSRYERMLVLFKNEIAAAVMEADAPTAEVVPNKEAPGTQG